MLIVSSRMFLVDWYIGIVVLTIIDK